MKDKRLTSPDGVLPRRGFLYELILEIMDPKAYLAYVRTILHLEAEQVATKAKADLASRRFLRTVDQVTTQIEKGEFSDED